jgi:DNA uptake protein ComE-like DNA-binding protein
MHHNIIKTATVAMALLLAAGYGYAAEKKAEAPGATAASAEASDKGAKDKKTAAPAKKQAAAPAKLVDINSATKAELMKLPGISEAIAEKIVAGRPYNTKARLVTRNIVSREVYEDIKKLVIAKQK